MFVEFQHRVTACLFGAVDKIKELDPNAHDVPKIVVSILNHQVPEDLLGTKWRRPKNANRCNDHGDGVPVTMASAVDGTVRIIDWVSFESAVGKAKLASREFAVVEQILAGNSLEETANILGIAPSTARVLKGRAVKKIRKIANGV